MGKFDCLSAQSRCHSDIHEECRLKILTVWVVSELFAAPRDFNELGLERLQFFPVVPRVPPPFRWDGREVAHGRVACTVYSLSKLALVNLRVE
jgi:hypothetical protein